MDGFNRRKIYLAANRHALSGSIFHTEFPILHFIRHMNTLSSLDKLRHRRPGPFSRNYLFPRIMYNVWKIFLPFNQILKRRFQSTDSKSDNKCPVWYFPHRGCWFMKNIKYPSQSTLSKIIPLSPRSLNIQIQIIWGQCPNCDKVCLIWQSLGVSQVTGHNFGD